MNNLVSEAKITRVENAAAAAQTDVTSDSVDMQGFGSCCFIIAAGAIADTGTFDAHAEGSSDDSNWDELDASITQMVTADDNKLAVLEIVNPQHRYLRVVIERGTADSSVDSVIAIQTAADREPVTQSATVDSATVVHAPAAI